MEQLANSNSVIFAKPHKYLICSLHHVFHSEVTLTDVNYINLVLIIPIIPRGEEGQAFPSQPPLPRICGTRYITTLRLAFS